MGTDKERAQNVSFFPLEEQVKAPAPELALEAELCWEHAAAAPLTVETGWAVSTAVSLAAPLGAQAGDGSHSSCITG